MVRFGREGQRRFCAIDRSFKWHPCRVGDRLQLADYSAADREPTSKTPTSVIDPAQAVHGGNECEQPVRSERLPNPTSAAPALSLVSTNHAVSVPVIPQLSNRTRAHRCMTYCQSAWHSVSAIR
ncbi:protein of unknown function (plasmid) [Caballeronia sp. S22]